MELHPLDPPDLNRPDPVGAGWTRAISRGPRTTGEVLAAASRAMDEQDEAEAYARDPIGYISARQARTTLWGRLFGRR